MTYPPSLQVRSGRRIGAGPGHLTSTSFGRGLSIALLLGLCTTLMVSPALIATLSMVFGGRLDVQLAPWVTPLTLVPVLEAGRILVTFALVTVVISAKELE